MRVVLSGCIEGLGSIPHTKSQLHFSFNFQLWVFLNFQYKNWLRHLDSVVDIALASFKDDIQVFHLLGTMVAMDLLRSS